MPELPEVERARKYLCSYIGKIIIRAKAANDTIVYSKQNPQEVVKKILGKKIIDVKRHGKVFWLELEDSYQLGFHFGMTGELKIKGKQLIEYRNSKSKADKSWPPRWYKMMIYVTNDNNLIKNIETLNEDLQRDSNTSADENEWKEENNEKVDCFAFCDVRRLGRVWLSKDIMKEEPLSNHGFDVMNEVPPFEEFLKSMKTKTCGIKSLLLDQSFSSGIGNWIADEVLYQAKIHPLENVSDLDDEDIKRIYHSLVEVITLAVSVNADADRFPEFWIFHYRWSKRSNGKGHIISIPNVGKIEFLKAGGRTTAIVPAIQKLKKKGNTKRKSVPDDKEISEDNDKVTEITTTKTQIKKSTKKVKKTVTTTDTTTNNVTKEEKLSSTKAMKQRNSNKKVKEEEKIILTEEEIKSPSKSKSKRNKIEEEEEKEKESSIKNPTKRRSKRVKMEEEKDKNKEEESAKRRSKRIKMEKVEEKEKESSTESPTKRRSKRVKIEKKEVKEDTIPSRSRSTQNKKITKKDTIKKTEVKSTHSYSLRSRK